MGIRSGRGRGGGHIAHHAAPAVPAAPTGIVVMGFKPEEKDAVVTHFSVSKPHSMN